MKPVDAVQWETPDGGALQAYTFGNPRAAKSKRVVVVCGAFLPALVYAPFASALVKKLGSSWGVYVYDRRGKGESSPVTEDYSLETEISDVFTALASSGAQHILGHSLGGSVTLHAVKELSATTDSQLRPLLPASATVYDPAINLEGSMDVSWVPEFQEHVQNGRFGRALALADKYFGTTPTLSRAPNFMVAGVLAITVRTGLRSITKATFPAAAAELGAAFSEEAKASDFADMPVRTCFMTGERSAEYFQTTTLRLAEQVHDSRLVVSPKGLHGSIPAVRHKIVDSYAFWLKEEPLGKLDLGAEALHNLSTT